MPTFTVSPERTRSGGDPRRIAVILPGGSYTPAGPLLHFARAVLVHHGWTVQELWWDTQTWTGEWEEWAAHVCEYATWALDRESATRALLVGKSLGTFAAEVAADRGLPGIWLTPLLTEERVQAALPRVSAPTLLVGGTADSLWDSDVAKRADVDVLEVPDADHAMEVGNAPVRSADILREVVTAMDAFVARLPA